MMMLCKNTSAMVRLPDGDTDAFVIFAGVLQGDTLAPYFFHNLPRLYTSNIDRANKRKWLYAEKKTRSRRYPAEIISDTNYKDDLALLANTADSEIHT